MSEVISGVVAGEASSTSTRFPITNLISPHLHYLPFASGFPLPHFAICLSFSSLPLHQFSVLFASLFRSPFFSLDLFLFAPLFCVVTMEKILSLRVQIINFK